MGEDAQNHLKHYIEQHSNGLHRAIRQIAARSNLTGDYTQIAHEVLSEVVVEALQHVERLQTPTNPFPWLMGIAVNLIKRRQSEDYRMSQREPLLHDLYQDESLTEAEIIDHLVVLAQDTVSFEIEAVLAVLSPDDAQILRLAVLMELDGEALGHTLGISPGAARVRLHRALKRLRQFWGNPARLEGLL